MKIDLSRILPVGMEQKSFISSFWAGFCGMFIYNGINFLFRFSDARSRLYWKNGVYRAIRDGAVMPDYVNLIRGLWGSLAVVLVIMLFWCFYNYFYHFQGTRSIYLMRRLPNKSELYRRCLAAPFIGILIYLIFAFLFLVVCYGIYMLATPEECLVPGQWQKIWITFGL